MPNRQSSWIRNARRCSSQHCASARYGGKYSWCYEQRILTKLTSYTRIRLSLPCSFLNIFFPFYQKFKFLIKNCTIKISMNVVNSLLKRILFSLYWFYLSFFEYLKKWFFILDSFDETKFTSSLLQWEVFYRRICKYFKLSLQMIDKVRMDCGIVSK